MNAPNEFELDRPVPPSEPDPISWMEGLGDLVSSRLGILQIEGKGVTRKLVRCAIFGALAAGCAICGYAVILAAGISLISRYAGWRWDWVAAAVALLHLLAAVILIMMAKPGMENTFAVTRAEFQKDREWLKNFKKSKNSSV